MKASLRSVPDQGRTASLSIGDLSRRTGVTAATLRVWETRYGFPVPRRRESGHRRYVESDVERILEVVRRREAGTRLDVAIEQALTTTASSVTEAQRSQQSVFAQLRQTHPALMPYRLKKRTLLALSWAIEDEFASRAEAGHLFGGFQRAHQYEPSASRWEQLARSAGSAYVFADFARSGGDTPHRVALEPDSPMLREWTVVCDVPTLPVALSAWELPGQQRKPDMERHFEAIWTVDPGAVRETARTATCVAIAAGAPGADEVLEDLGSEPDRREMDNAAVAVLFNRMVAYTDTLPPR